MVILHAGDNAVSLNHPGARISGNAPRDAPGGNGSSGRGLLRRPDEMRHFND